jgi:outer membrane protein
MKGYRLSAFGGLLVASLLAGPALGQAAGQKIGVIEVQRIVQDSAVGKESLSRVQKLSVAKQEELARRQKELRDLEQKIQEQGKSLSEDAMEKLQKDYQAKALDLKRFQDDAQRELEEAQRKELGELEKRVMPVIDSVAKEQGYTLIFNKYQSGLLFADAGIDITDSVITKFNSQIAAAPKSDTKAPAAAPKAPAPTAAPVPKKN